MKPLFIRLKNVGPFLDSQIDFEKLDRIFLITGSTGAGKTFIFDAMAFAIYGAAAGRRGEGKNENLLSDFWNKKEDAFVDFRFEKQGEHFKIVRYLEKKTPPISKKLIFEKFDFNAEKFFAVPQADNKSILQTVNLTRDEFLKVVLLPQGEFSKLISSTSTEKAKILSKMFPVQNFLKIRELAAKEKKNLEQNFNAITLSANGILGEKNLEQIKLELENAKSHVAEISKIAEEKKDLRIKLEGEISKVEQKIEDAAKKNRLQKKLLDLQSQKSEIENLKEKLDFSRNVAPVRPFFFAAKNAQEDFLEKSNLEKSFLQKLNVAEENFFKAQNEGEKISQLEIQLEKTLSQTQNFSALLKKAENLFRYENESQNAKNIFLKLKSERESIEKNILELKDQIPNQDCAQYLLELEKNRNEIEKKIAVAEFDFDRTKKRDLLKTQIEEAKNLKESLEKKFNETCQNLLDAKNTLLEANAKIRYAEILEKAATLAKELKEDFPCPVCGSKNHPKPAEFSSEILKNLPDCQKLENQIDEFESQKNFLTSELAKSEENLKNLLKNLENLFENSSEKRDLTFLDAQKNLTEVKNENQKNQNEIEKTKIIKNKLDLLEPKFEKNQKLEREAKIAFEKSKSAQIEFEKNFLQEKNFPKEFFEEKDFEKIVLHFKNALENAEKDAKKIRNEKNALTQNLEKSKINLASAKSDFSAAQNAKLESEKKSKIAKENLDLQAERAGFSGVEWAQKEFFDEEKCKIAQKKINSYFEEIAATQKLFDEIKCVTSYDFAVEEKSALEKQKLECQEKIFSLEQDSKKLLREIATAEEKIFQYERLENEKSQIQKRLEIFRYLDSLLNGKIPFDLWALGVYLDDVLRYASRRFFRFSDGQYTFRLSDRAGGQGKNGLDISVLDSRTGRMRDVSSLSGGETFEASISLALALTDKVGAQGGLSLDSIFIDEGFGTLDSRTREKAMPILNELSETKTVGIISHVESFQSEIPCKVKVEKSNGTSKISIARE